VGLAAPQVHEELRVFVAQVVRNHDDEDEDEAGEPEILALVNPRSSPPAAMSRRIGKAA